MEILNNIWTALSTQNEWLITILAIPLTFLENFLILHLFTNLLNIKTSKKQKIIYSISVPIITLLTLNFIPTPYNSCVNYIILFFIIYFTFRIGILKSLISVIIPAAIIVLIGALTLNPFVKITQIDLNLILTIPIYRITYSLVNYLILFLTILFIKNRKLYFHTLDEVDKKTKTISIISILLGFFVLVLQLIIMAYYTNELPVIISILSFITLFSYIILSIYSLTRVTKLVLTKRQLENAEEYNRTLQILHDSVRCFKHDYDNTIAAMGGYVRTNDMEGLRKYYKELEDDVMKVSSLYMLNPEIINNPAIYSILANKYHKADEANVKLNLTVLLDLNTIDMKIYEFTKILGILLDNSIEAAKECDEKILNIIIKDDSKNNRQLLIVENTYRQKDVDLDKIFEKGITGKENHTGLGLWEIRKILKKNNNLNLHTTKNEKYFIQQLEIYKSEK